ncbi:hypothetical protein ACO0LM_14365 [Undibacterium sp. Di26W]|uniref:hypothetical protein n=1 Tax=Undibacterium sp. Di26W TaxID=3413035 RepID=UPI003BF32B21
MENPDVTLPTYYYKGSFPVNPNEYYVTGNAEIIYPFAMQQQWQIAGKICVFGRRDDSYREQQ